MKARGSQVAQISRRWRSLRFFRATGVQTAEFLKSETLRYKTLCRAFLLFGGLLLAANIGRAAAQSATVLNRVVAAIGPEAITQSDVVQEYRIEQFLSGRSIPLTAPDTATFAQVESRLINQKLLEAELSSYAANGQPARKVAETRLEQLSGKPGFERALQVLGLSRNTLLQRLDDQQRVLAMIDQRLRPAVSLSQQDEQTYYDDVFVPEFKKRSAGAPPAFAAVRDQIQQVLTQKKIDELLDHWMDELRSEQKVRVISQ